eukprot:12061-Heterococcus_DN1.PRE.2
MSTGSLHAVHVLCGLFRAPTHLQNALIGWRGPTAVQSECICGPECTAVYHTLNKGTCDNLQTDGAEARPWEYRMAAVLDLQYDPECGTDSSGGSTGGLQGRERTLYSSQLCRAVVQSVKCHVADVATHATAQAPECLHEFLRCQHACSHSVRTLSCCEHTSYC